MNGRTDSEILEDFEVALEKASQWAGEPLLLIDSFQDDKAEENTEDGVIKDIKPIELLGESIKLMQGADYYLCWATQEELLKSRGCKIEEHVAHEYKIPFVPIKKNV
jgi:hypothetical protein